MARLFSYVVLYDVGFAPNPFHGFCSLACCKPRIRKKADIGDLIVGTTSTKGGVDPKLLYIMKVTDSTDFSNYWSNTKFIDKKPDLERSVKYCVGDNIYHKVKGNWVQENSRHTNLDGTTNKENLNTDTGANKVLLSTNFVYWGANAIPVPGFLRCGIPSEDIVHKGQGHKEACFSPTFIKEVEEWFKDLPDRGIQGFPTEWENDSEFIKTVLNK